MRTALNKLLSDDSNSSSVVLKYSDWKKKHIATCSVSVLLIIKSYYEATLVLQAEEPKQLADEASRFHLGRQRQHSAVICSGALLFSSRVLCPCSLVTLCSHKSGRFTVELYHASHLWYPPFYTCPMASSALQH